MAKTIKRYHNCVPTGDTYDGTESAVTTNGTEGILKVTVANPERPLEPLKEYIVDTQPGAVATLPAGLLDRNGDAITDAEIVVIVEGQTVPEMVIIDTP